MIRSTLIGALAALSAGGVTLAQQPGPGPAPGCPLSGCAYTGSINYGPTGSALPGSGQNAWMLNSVGSLYLGRTGSNPQVAWYRTEATGVAASIGFLHGYENNAAGTSLEFGRQTLSSTSVMAGSETGRWAFALYGAGALNTYLQLDPLHLTLPLGGVVDSTGGTLPVLTGFGTSPSDSLATDEGGDVKVGSSPGTTGSIAFSINHNNKPSCTVTRPAIPSGQTFNALASNTGIAITSSGTMVAGEFFTWTCVFHG